MKSVFNIMILFFAFTGFAQDSQDEADAKQVVIGFFEAFHQQDSVALMELAHSTVTMQSIAEGKEGKKKLSSNKYSDFVKAITSIPADTKIEEKLHSFDVQVNGPLANVTTPYSFYQNGNLSHCGVNSFTMVKEAEEWKIVYIIDTRRKENCNSL